MSAGNAHAGNAPHQRYWIEPHLVIGLAAGAMLLAIVAPASAVVTGPAMLIAGLVGLRRARGRGRRGHLVLMTGLGVALTITALLVAVLLVRSN